MDTVTDRVLSCLLSAVVIGMIAFSAGAALWLAYGGILRLCEGRIAYAALLIASAAIPAAACYALCRCGNDLMDR